MKPETSTLIAALALGVALAWPVAASAADAPAKQAKPASKAQQKQSKAKGMALAEATVQRISEAQLLVADRVLTGDAACEFNQKVSVLPVKDRAGHFHVAFKKAVYTMVPEETSTGAVRLEDKKAGVVWLQIPAKSMRRPALRPRPPARPAPPTARTESIRARGRPPCREAPAIPQSPPLAGFFMPEPGRCATIPFNSRSQAQKSLGKSYIRHKIWDKP